MEKKDSKEKAIAAGKSAAKKKRSILIVESDSHLQSLLAGTFRLQNFHVHTASSAKTAASAYLAIGKHVDVVLLNGNAVGVEGIDTILAIRRLNPEQKMILIATEDNVEVNAMKVKGLFVVIMRPLTVDKVVQEVLKLIKQRR